MSLKMCHAMLLLLLLCLKHGMIDNMAYLENKLIE